MPPQKALLFLFRAVDLLRSLLRHGLLTRFFLCLLLFLLLFDLRGVGFGLDGSFFCDSFGLFTGFLLGLLLLLFLFGGLFSHFLGCLLRRLFFDFVLLLFLLFRRSH